MLRWLALSGLVVLIDQVTKWIAERGLALHDPVAVVPYFNLTLTYNTGAAFSFLSRAGGWQRWFFIVLATAVSVAIVVWLSRLDRGERWTAAGLALVLGGAVGNLIDRLAHGHVIDFIDLYYGAYHWPAFNVADSSISVGAGILIVHGLLDARNAGSE
jgi:signal peptidase II